MFQLKSIIRYKFSLLLLLILLLCLAPLIFYTYYRLSAVTRYYTINVCYTVRHKLIPEFLSHTLQSGTIKDGTIDWYLNNKKFQQLVSHLSPAYIRIGGYRGNFMIFDEFVETNNFTEEYAMTLKTWDNINDFCRNQTMPLVFNLNMFLRTENDERDFSNIEKLFNYTNYRNYSVIWQLGNEPDYMVRHGKSNITGQQFASDCIAVKELLQKYPNLKNSKIVGPETTGSRMSKNLNNVFLNIFLKELSDLKKHEILNVITSHQYYLSGRTAVLKDFLNLESLKTFEKQLAYLRSLIENYAPIYTNVPIWLTETGSAFAGGAQNLSDRFAGTFLLIDKLGVAANNGIQMIFRQALYKNNYAMFDDNLDPNPDYWISVLFKKLVGNIVLTCKNFVDEYLRIYCHLNEQGNKMTYFGSNIAKHKYCIDFKNVDFSVQNSVFIEFYSLTAHENNLQSKYVELNGQVLKVQDDYKIPEFSPQLFKINDTICISPYSIFFIIIVS